MIIFPNGLTTQELRVLQEFRRLNAETLTVEQIKAIKHPAGGGEAPASLAGKGFLVAEGDGFTTTAKARELLSFDPVPEFEGGSGADEAAGDDA